MTANVADLVAEAAADAGDRPAIIDPNGSVATWGDVDRRVDGVAAQLSGAGVRPGDRVAIMLPNGAAFAASFWGVLRAGATVVPVNPAYTPPERDYILGDSGAGWIFPPAPDLQLPDGVVPLDPFQDSARAVPTVEAAQCAVICYTSGTTGRPKGALLSHANLLANLESFSELPRLQLQADDVRLGLLPFFHVFGLNVVLNAAARQGAAVLAVDRFSPRSTAAAMAEHGVTVAYGAPPVFAALAGADGLALPGLRAAVSGADGLPVRVWQRFGERFGLEIVEGYGLTETAPVLATNAAAPRARAGTVGLAVPDVTLRLVAPSGETIDSGEGEIQARGPNVFSGYHARPDESAVVLRDGWFSTGDVGSYDEDGYLRIVGRLKDMIIVSGFNVYPREVEDALLAHPDVAEAAVVGVPDARTGEQVRAAVVPKAGSDVTADALLGFCRERLARYKLPREIRLLATLPRLPTGKLARQALRD